MFSLTVCQTEQSPREKSLLLLLPFPPPAPPPPTLPPRCAKSPLSCPALIQLFGHIDRPTKGIISESVCHKQLAIRNKNLPFLLRPSPAAGVSGSSHASIYFSNSTARNSAFPLNQVAYQKLDYADRNSLSEVLHLLFFTGQGVSSAQVYIHD